MGQVIPLAKYVVSKTTQNIRVRLERFEVFRTPTSAFTPLFDYRPEWFEGSGYDPSAGDARMLGEIIRRGNAGPHYANDIRDEEARGMHAVVGTAHTTVGDYLSTDVVPVCDFMITNPPFSLAMDFVRKAREHVTGPICILQRSNWQCAQKRIKWLKEESGLAFVLNLSQRPKWEVDTGENIENNIWDYSWFVFLPGYEGLPQVDWIGQVDTRPKARKALRAYQPKEDTMKFLELADDKLKATFERQAPDHSKDRAAFIARLRKQKENFASGVTKGRKDWKAANDVVSFTPTYAGQSLSIGRKSEFYVPSERFGEFIDAMIASVEAGELDDVLASAKLAGDLTRGGGATNPKDIAAQMASSRTRGGGAGWSPERRARYEATVAARKAKA